MRSTHREGRGARRAFGRSLRRGHFGPFHVGPRGFTPAFRHEGQHTLPGFLPLDVHESRFLLAALDVRAFGLALPALRSLTVSALSGQCPDRAGRRPRPTMPSADSCRTVRTSCDALSHDSVTRGRPPEVSLATFDARPPDLHPRRLVDMDFAVNCPLVPSRRPPIRFLSIGPHLRYRFLQTTPRGAALADRLSFTSTRLDRGLSPPSCQTCSAHRTLAPPGRTTETARTSSARLSC
jgi:hypothetical protein